MEFLIRIVYKSGNTQEFWVKKFTISGGTYSWVHADEIHRPLQMGADEIAAVWQVGKRDA